MENKKGNRSFGHKNAYRVFTQKKKEKHGLANVGGGSYFGIVFNPQILFMISIISRKSTGDVDMVKAETMKKRFWMTNSKDKPGFWLNVSSYRKFLRSAILASPPSEKIKTKAIAIRPGRSTEINAEINFSLEIVFYDKKYKQKPTNIERLADGFEGRLASNFGKKYSIEEIDIAVEIKDNYLPAGAITEWIMIELESLESFTPANEGEKPKYDNVLVEFARDENDQLTVIVSRYLKGKIVQYPENEDSVTTGFFLDDHDLLP